MAEHTKLRRSAMLKAVLYIENGDAVATMERDFRGWDKLADFIVQACNTHTAREKLIKDLVTALEEIRDAETDCCPRCEGNGNIYADGNTHYMSEHAPTIPCGNCGGIGQLQPANAQDMARAALEAAKKEMKT